MNIFPGLVLKRRIKEIKTNYTDPRFARRYMFVAIGLRTMYKNV